MQFGSFLEPLSIMLSLPLSLIGVMLALLLANESLNIMSMIGVILLVGIVAKNAILLIDFAKWSEAGMPRRGRSFRLARAPAADSDDDVRARGRHGAVAMGTGEGGDFRAPLGITVIGGVVDVADIARHPHCARYWRIAGIGWERVYSALATRLFESPGTRVLPGRRRQT